MWVKTGIKASRRAKLQVFGPLEALFFRRLCRACRGRAGAGVAQVTFPPSGAGLGCLARALFGYFLGYAGALWAKTGIQACRRAKIQVCSFFGASGGAFFVTPVQGLLGQGWGRGGASNLCSLRCWVGVPGAGRIWMDFWGMLGLFGSKLASERLEGQVCRFAAFVGPLGALFFWPLCRAC